MSDYRHDELIATYERLAVLCKDMAALTRKNADTKVQMQDYNYLTLKVASLRGLKA